MRRLAAGLFAAALPVLAAGRAAGAQEIASPAPPAPPVVRAIEIRSDGPVDLVEIGRLLEIRVGEPLDDDVIRRTLRSLRFAEIASEASISVERAPDGTATAIVSLWTPIDVAVVEIRGETGLKPERLREELPVAPGQVLLEDRVVRGLYDIQDRLAAEGYLGAKVDLDVRVDAPARAATVIYDVAAGPRTKVGAVRFEGTEGVATQAELEDELRAGPGDSFRARAVEENLEALQRFLAARDYRSATVERLADVENQAAATIDLAYRVVAGPKLELTIVGAERKALKKRGLLPFLDAGGYDDALVLQAVERIRRHYQEKGHYRVEVRRTEERLPDRLKLTLEIVPGPRYALEELAFDGNESYGEERLSRLLNTTPRRFLSPKSGRLVDAELSADLSNLRSFYALEGFDRAEIGPARIEEEGARLAVRIPIEEGRQRTVSTLTFEGLAPLDEQELRRILPLTDGGPYHRLRVEQSEDFVRERLEALGYGHAIVDSATVWSEDEVTAAVTLSAVPGRRETVSTLILHGLEKTRPEVVRKFLGLEVGDPVSRSALLDVQRRLYAVGVFTRVEVRVPPTAEVGDAREVLVELAEGQTRAASVGLGYDSESGIRGLLRLSQANLFGRLQSLTLDILASQREQRSRLIFRQPYIGNFLAELEGAVYDEHEERPEFTVDRRGVQGTIERPIDAWSLQWVLSLRLVNTEAAESEREAEIPLESRDARVASFTQGVTYDRRNDLLDPTRGWFANGSLEYAAPVASADANFLKFFAQTSRYQPIGRRMVLAGSVRVGAIEPLASSEDPAVDPLDVSAPAAELFYAGGRTSHRAYERDTLGVVGETLLPPEDGLDAFPTGGGGLLLANLELRFPVAGPIGGTVFLDGGNVWKEYGSIDPSALKWGAGVGVRYLSPIGPLRAEIGWKLDPEPFEDQYVWFISLGNAF